METSEHGSVNEVLEESKRAQVESMFDGISHRYDRLNRILSFRSDVRWRRKAVKMLKPYKNALILDLASGTGDLAIALCKLNPHRIEAVDVSAGMLHLAEQKIHQAKWQHIVHITKAAAEQLPFDDQSFDTVTVAFGVRNFANLDKGLLEIHRVLKNGGHLLVLEFGMPDTWLIGPIYKWYFKNILPAIGRLVSGSKIAYQYLPETVQQFPYGKAFEKIISDLGFTPICLQKLSCGVAYNYLFRK